MTNEGMTPADIKACMGDSDGFGNGAWWIIILFLFAFCGWGGNGWNGNNSGASDNYVLASDFATLQRQIDASTDRLSQQSNGIANGLCDGFYTQAQLVNGINNTVMQNGFNLQTQLANCCCENRSAIADLKYNMAQNSNAEQQAITNGFCQTNYNASNNTRDIVESQNASTQAILAKLNSMEINAKDEKIAEQQATINALQLNASQQAQNAYLISELAPKAPIPSFTVPNPYATYYSGCSCSM